MKASTYSRSGGPDVFEYRDLPDPTPSDTDILVRVEAISVEGGDLITRRLVSPASPTHIPGYAAAGEVVAVGKDVTGFRIGQKVATFGFGGAYAELRAVSASTSWVVPDEMDIVQAAAAVVGVGTALDALSLGEFTPGERVLITGAAGAVGIAAIQIASRAGARVLGTSSSYESLEALRQFGLTDAVQLDGSPLSEKVAKILDGQGADLLIDNVGGAALAEGLEALRKGGRAVLVGAVGDGRKNLDSSSILLNRLRLTGCFLGPVMDEPDRRKMIAKAIDLVARGEVRIPIDRSFALRDAAAAHARAEERGRVGRVILIPENAAG